MARGGVDGWEPFSSACPCSWYSLACGCGVVSTANGLTGKVLPVPLAVILAVVAVLRGRISSVSLPVILAVGVILSLGVGVGVVSAVSVWSEDKGSDGRLARALVLGTKASIKQTQDMI